MHNYVYLSDSTYLLIVETGTCTARSCPGMPRYSTGHATATGTYVSYQLLNIPISPTPCFGHAVVMHCACALKHNKPRAAYAQAPATAAAAARNPHHTQDRHAIAVRIMRMRIT